MTVAHAVPHRFTVDDYHRMAADGILTPGQRVELIQGEVVEMTPIGSRHAAVVNRITRLTVTAVGECAIVSVQNPVRVSDIDEPEPDLAVLKQRADDYADSLPGPEDVLLLIEVADSSLAYDRDTKLPLYARAGIPEVWLISLPDAAIEVHTVPSDSGYRSRHIAKSGETIAAEAIPPVRFPVESVLP